jgi:prepilin-type N-terminal cleavage/methylation domain-containing protein
MTGIRPQPILRCSLAPRLRGGYTLLEVLLALAISVLLLGGLYVAVDTQLRLAQSGREVVEQSTLARSLLSRMHTDIASSANLCDPARYRVQSSSSSGSGGSGGMGGSSGGMSGTGGTTGASGTTGATAGGTGATGASGTAGASATSGNSASGTSNSNSTTSNTTTSPGTAVTLPLGVQGDASTLHMFASKVPREVWGTQDGDPPIVGDLRRISYWLVDSGNARGLARQEVKVATAQDAATLPPGIDNEASYIIAHEVRTLSFSYFDGTSWNDSWDSTQLGADGVTPIGPPRAIAVTVGIPRLSTGQPGNIGERAVKNYRHVVGILTANGATQSNTGDGTSTP